MHILYLYCTAQLPLFTTIAHTAKWQTCRISITATECMCSHHFINHAFWIAWCSYKTNSLFPSVFFLLVWYIRPKNGIHCSIFKESTKFFCTLVVHPYNSLYLTILWRRDILTVFELLLIYEGAFPTGQAISGTVFDCVNVSIYLNIYHTDMHTVFCSPDVLFNKLSFQSYSLLSRYL